MITKSGSELAKEAALPANMLGTGLSWLGKKLSRRASRASNFGSGALLNGMRRLGATGDQLRNAQFNMLRAHNAVGRNAMRAGQQIMKYRNPIAIGTGMLGAGAVGYQLGKPAQPVYKTY